MHRVLVVDDSSVVQVLYKQSFRGLPGIEVQYVKSGVEALAAVQKGPPFHLIFLDINMPKMDGLECLGQLKARGVLDTARVVIVSTESSKADVERGLAAGASQYLKKPFEQADLKAAVNRHLVEGAASSAGSGGA